MTSSRHWRLARAPACLVAPIYMDLRRGAGPVSSMRLASYGENWTQRWRLRAAKTSVTLIVAPWCTQQRSSEEHTSELKTLMRNSYAVFCLKQIKYRPSNQKNNKY